MKDEDLDEGDEGNDTESAVVVDGPNDDEDAEEELDENEEDLVLGK